MARRIKWRLGDTCALQESLSRVTGVQGLAVEHDGQIRIPDEASISERVQLIQAMFDIKSQQDIWVKFQIGNMVNALPNPAHGDKTAFCKEKFGEQNGMNAMMFAWVAHKWRGNQNVGWSWTFYKEAANSTPADKTSYVALWQMGRLTILDLREKCKAKRDAIKNSHGNVSDKPDSPLDANTIYRESDCLYLKANHEQGCLDLLNFDEEKLGSVGAEAATTMFDYACTVASPVQWNQCKMIFEAQRKQRESNQ